MTPGPLEYRRALADGLRSALPATWRVVASVRTVDRLDGPLVQIKPGTFTPNPAAPHRALDHSATVTVVSPLIDLDRAADDLDDDLLPALLGALADLDFAVVTSGELVTYADQHLAYDIAVTITETHNPS